MNETVGLWVFIGLMTYLAGWVGTARWVAHEEIKEEGRITDDALVKLLATLWPFTVPVGIVLLLFETLYKVAIKNAGLTRAERKERKIKERDRVIKELEISEGIVKPKPQDTLLNRTDPLSAVAFAFPSDDKHEWDWGD